MIQAEPPLGPNTAVYLDQLKEAAKLPGDVAECGVYRGHNLYHYAKLLSQVAPSKTLFGFDSFAGFPRDADDVPGRGKFANCSLDDTFELLRGFHKVCLVKGFFRTTLQAVANSIFCCVILDCDLYLSHRTCLEFFYQQLTPGGILILDEYYSLKYPGARRAVDEFCVGSREKPEMFHVETNGWQRWRIVKR